MLAHALSFSWWVAFLGEAWRWHAATVLIGWLVFPAVFSFLRPLPDRGYAVSRILGAFLLTYLNWMLCHRMMTFSRVSLEASLGLMGLVSLVAAIRYWREIGAYLRERWRWVLAAETLAFVLFLLLLNIRSYCPDINFRPELHGSEKLGNMMMLSSLWRAERFPTEDAWFCIERPANEEAQPAFLNYYYGGHLQWATLARLTGYKPEVAFNLALATLFSWIGMGAYGLALNLTRRQFPAIAAAVLLVFAGNLEAVEQLAGMNRAYREFETQEDGIPNFQKFMTTRRFDLWSSSRVILRGGEDYGGQTGLTVNEFPYFSFILGDLHAHSSALPLTLALLQVLLALWLRKEAGAWNWFESALYSPRAFLALCLLAGGLYWYNSWEIIPLGILLAVFLFWDSHDLKARRFAAPATAALLLAALFAVGLFVFLLPFVREMQSPLIQGTNFKERLESSAKLIRLRPWRLATKSYELLLFWGLIWTPLALVLSRHMAASLARIRSGQFRAFCLALAAFCAALLGMYSGGLALPICLALSLAAASLAWRREAPFAERFAARLALAGFLTVLCAEAFYLDDSMSDLYERYNTVFKLYYPAWAELTVAAVVFVWAESNRASQEGRRVARAILLSVAGALCALGMAYPVLATWARTDGFFTLKTAKDGRYAGVRQAASMRRRTLNGLDYLSDPAFAPDDLKAIRWLNANVTGRPHILEAERPAADMSGRVNSAYSESGRVSALTGLPAIVGWDNHEAQWRGWAAWQPIIHTRQTETREAFETTNPARAMDVLYKYYISYVFVGRLERAVYTPEQLAKFSSFGTEVFRSGDTCIYKIGAIVPMSASAPSGGTP